jgi:hypothetical protein
VQLIATQPINLKRAALDFERDTNASRVRDQRRHVSKRRGHGKKSPTDSLQPIAPQTSQAKHQKRRDEKVNSGTRHSDHEPVIAAHITRVRLKRERPAAQQFNQRRRRRQYPSQLVCRCVRVIKLERQSAQQHGGELCAPD